MERIQAAQKARNARNIVSYPFPSRSLTLLSVIWILQITQTGVPFTGVNGTLRMCLRVPDIPEPLEIHWEHNIISQSKGHNRHKPTTDCPQRQPGFLEHRPVFQSGFHYLGTEFRTIGRGFSRDFSTPSCFLSPHTAGFFTRLLFLFLHIVRELLPFISL